MKYSFLYLNTSYPLKQSFWIEYSLNPPYSNQFNLQALKSSVYSFISFRFQSNSLFSLYGKVWETSDVSINLDMVKIPFLYLNQITYLMISFTFPKKPNKDSLFYIFTAIEINIMNKEPRSEPLQTKFPIIAK